MQQTRIAVDKKTELPSDGGNKYNQNRPANIRPNVRTTEFSKMIEIVLNDPDSVTHEEFLLFQSAMGYSQAVRLMEEGKRRKRERDEQQQTLVKIPSVEKEQQGLIVSKPEGTQQSDTVPVATAKEGQPIQLKKEDGKELASKEDEAGLPNNLRSRLEKLSGTILYDVSVHRNSDKPQQLGALAYTQGNAIHLAPRQERHLPHEGWHAVQQKQGRVEPTLQMKAEALVNDDAGLEKEADIMGSRAAKEDSQNSNQDSPNSKVQSSINIGTQSTTFQIRKPYQIQSRNHKGNVIQRVTTTKGKATVGEITQAEYGEKSENVKRIQKILMEMKYWTGDDNATGYFGTVTRDSLINFQIGYMKLEKKDLYNKNGKYVGCGPSTAKSLNNVYKLLNNPNVPLEVKNGIMRVENTKGSNTPKPFNYQGDIGANQGAGKTQDFIGPVFTKGTIKTGQLSGSINGLTSAERTVVNDLLSQGKNVEIIPTTTASKTPDFLVNGIKTELKSLENPNINTGITRIQKGFKQGAETVIIDGRQAGLTTDQANQILNRASGTYQNKTLPGQVEIWTNDGVIRR